MTIKTAIGLMSGTSMDGIDAALLQTDGENSVKRGAVSFYPYSPQTQNLLNKALEDAKDLEDRDQRIGALADVEKLITELHSKAVCSFLKEHQMQVSEVDVIGFHGQTVLHRPEKSMTVQLGDGDMLAKATGIDVVYDMRANDMAQGGQGAPLVPIYHKALANSLQAPFRNQHPIVFVNIGGISNITYIDEELIAFDSGPGNALIDQWVQSQAGIPYDQGGMIASEGGIDATLSQRYLANPYFEKKLPKSLDRNDFLPPRSNEIGLEDGARTLANVSASAIMRATDHLPKTPKLWIVCGGGRHNPHIVSDMKKLAQTSNATVIKAEEAALDGDAMEAEAWAYLAVRSLKQLPLTFPKTTGCQEPVTGGKFASHLK